mmetsp:Transcript_49773/g.131972  ORF Transcript_49773/g.131972 Transcript_49773/m.131972 type:complete len:529 (-) Transcript_49773:213-1799(-)
MEPSQPPLVDMQDVLAHGGKQARAEERYVTSRYIGRDLKVSSRVVGAGLSGKVVLARRRYGGGQCAVKSFVKEPLSKEATEDLKREVEIYLTLDHPRIARLECVYETRALVHVVMEYLDGGDLCDKLCEQHLFDEGAAARAMRQILQAIGYLHSRKVVHRDVKPENVVCVNDDATDLKLVDFGYSCRWEGTEPLERRCGTVGYVALEVYERSYTPKVDLWSAGVIAYVLLTGSAPLPDKPSDAREALQKGTPWSSAFTALSQDAQSFVHLLMSVDPQHRPTAREALRHPWLVGHPEEHVPLNHDLLASLRLFASAKRAQRTQILREAWHATSASTALGRAQYLALCDDEPALPRERFVSKIVSEFGVSSDEAERLFDVLDDGSTGEVCYTWFLAGVLSSKSLPDEEPFAAFDTAEDSLFPSLQADTWELFSWIWSQSSRSLSGRSQKRGAGTPSNTSAWFWSVCPVRNQGPIRFPLSEVYPVSLHCTRPSAPMKAVCSNADLLDDTRGWRLRRLHKHCAEARHHLAAF